MKPASRHGRTTFVRVLVPALTLLLAASCAPPRSGDGPVATDPPSVTTLGLVGVPMGAFPSYEERLQLMAINRGRADPNNVPLGTADPCSTPRPVNPPVMWDLDINQAARFHCDMLIINDGGLSHDSYCDVRSDVESTGCDGSASCACQAGTECWNCTTLGGCGTGPSGRMNIFGYTGGTYGEIGYANPSDSWAAVEGWITEDLCNEPTEGHRNIITSGSYNVAGSGFAEGSSACWARYYFTDFGNYGGTVIARIPSGVHYPETGSSSTNFEFRANYYDASGSPNSIDVVIDGTCYPMSVELGSGGNETYLHTSSLSSGCHEYYFLAYDDSGTRVTYPETGSLTVSVTGGGGCANLYIATQMPAGCEAGVCGDGSCDGAAGETCSNCPADCGACPPVCGDGTCDAGEDCMGCATDCGACPPVCGDGSCNGSEDCMSCASDCGACPPVCGDGSCNGSEDCASCVADCGACPPMCGDSTCDPGEDCVSCPGDCGMCPPTCGDGTCQASEDCVSCPGDCGTCPAVCGDGTCEAVEDCSGCPADCGACPPVCGDGACNGSEDCVSCAGDCGGCPPVCGDGSCNGVEDCTTCASDCGTCPACNDGDTQPCGTGACAGMQACTGGTWTTCDGTPPAAMETCGDGIDDDCNGMIDDGCNGGGSDAGTGSDAAVVPDGGPIGGSPTVITGSCGCRVGRTGAPAEASVLLLAGFGLVWVGCRRRRGSASRS